jgi:pimeloyl-ACP methyl ester carboxylesterase
MGGHMAGMGHVVFVHGLLMTGRESLVLRRRLERHFGFRVHRFRYRTVTSTMAEVTYKLWRFVHELQVPRVHFVGHSLGGLVIYRFLERYPRESVGRVVFMGTPCRPSRAAISLNQHSRLAAALMSHSAAQELLRARERRWTLERDLGIIAGTTRVGMGQLVARFNEASDGTVAVSETELPGATEHIVLPVSHLGMLMSARVARETGLFLREGHFSAEPLRERLPRSAGGRP